MLQILLSGVLAWIVTPRFCRWCDHVVAARRVAGACRNSDSETPHVMHSRSQPDNSIELFEALAIAIRSGVHSHSALVSVASHQHFPPSFSHLVETHSEHPLPHILRLLHEAAENTHQRQIAALLAQSFRDNTFQPFALDLAAETLRSSRQLATQSLAASAQARTTMRLLTVMPVLVFIVGLFASSTLRDFVQRPAVIGLLLFGLFLNLMAYQWMTRLVRSVSHHHELTGLQELLTSAAISVRSGASLQQALQEWEPLNPVGHSVTLRLSEGASIAHALSPLTDSFGETGTMVRQLIVDSAHSGTPLADLFSRLLDDVHSESLRQTTIAIQQLSTKLTLPLVFCVLPSFLLLALMPIAIVSIGSLPSLSSV